MRCFRVTFYEREMGGSQKNFEGTTFDKFEAPIRLVLYGFSLANKFCPAQLIAPFLLCNALLFCVQYPKTKNI